MGAAQVITSGSALLAFTAMAFKGDNQLMLFLQLPKQAATSERAVEWAQAALYHLRNLVIMRVGIPRIEEDLRANSYERVKRDLKLAIAPVLEEGFLWSLETLATCERVYPIIETKAIKGAIKQLCDKFKVEHCALLHKQGLIACTKGW